MAEIFLATENVLGIFQVLSKTQTVSAASSTLTLTQSVQVVNTANLLESELTLVQELAVNKVLALSASSSFSMNSRSVRSFERYINQLFSISHSAKKVLPQSVTHTLIFTQEASYVRGLENVLELEQAAVVNIIKQCLVNHSLTLSQGVVALIDGNWQFVGVYTPVDLADYDPSSIQIPPTVAAQPVQFIGGPYALTFTNVEFNNSDSVEHARIKRYSRGEDLILYRDSRWGKTEVLRFKLIGLSASQGKSMLAFLNANLAQRIKFQDWMGVRWLGVITNPEATLVQSGRDPCGRFELEIQFQGVQTGYTLSETIGNELSLVGSPAGVIE